MSANELAALREELKAKIDNADEYTLAEIADFFAADISDLEDLSSELDEAIRISTAQADAGDVIPHSEVKEIYKKWITK